MAAMNLVSGALNYIAGNDRSSGSGSVRKLIERIKNSPLPQDRRKTIKELTKEVKKVCRFRGKSGLDLFVVMTLQ